MTFFASKTATSLSDLASTESASAVLEMLFLQAVIDTTKIARGKNILLVDDDPSARNSLRLLLSIDRHRVTEATSGREALHLFTGGSYDLVIMDYFMPDMLGDELAKNIKYLAPSQPLVLVTAYEEKLVDVRQTANAVLGKPLSLDELRRAIVAASS